MKTTVKSTMKRRHDNCSQLSDNTINDMMSSVNTPNRTGYRPLTPNRAIDNYHIEKTTPAFFLFMCTSALQESRLLRPQAAAMTPALSHQIIYLSSSHYLSVRRPLPYRLVNAGKSDYKKKKISVRRYSFSLYLQLFSHWVFARKRFLTRSVTFCTSASAFRHSATSVDLATLHSALCTSECCHYSVLPLPPYRPMLPL